MFIQSIRRLFIAVGHAYHCCPNSSKLVSRGSYSWLISTAGFTLILLGFIVMGFNALLSAYHIGGLMSCSHVITPCGITRQVAMVLNLFAAPLSGLFARGFNLQLVLPQPRRHHSQCVWMKNTWGNKRLMIDGYLFKIKNKTDNGLFYWRCVG